MEQIIKHTKYVDPMIDVAFKQLLGQEKNKHLTRSKQIGEFIVEMQVREQRHFSKRALYYSTFPITAQAPKGDWNYDFKPVFFLGILNFKISEMNGFIHRYSILEEGSGHQLTDALQFVFMEVGPFNKAWEQCKSFEEKFLYYFKNLPTFASKPDTQQDSYFEELLAAAEYSNMTKAEREAYNRRLKIRRDNYAADEFAREKAALELEKSVAEGRAEGRAEGKAESQIQIARNLLAMGLSPEQVAQGTGLKIEEVSKLK